MKSLYTYRSYRKFLADFYTHQKSKDSSYSYKRFSDFAGLNSPNYLALVIKGSRNLTIPNIHQFAKALNLSESEWNYFEALVLQNQSKSKEEKDFYQRRLKQSQLYFPSSYSKLEPDWFIGNWSYPAILLFCHNRSPLQAQEKIIKHFGLDAERASFLIRDFIGSKLLIENENVLSISSSLIEFHSSEAKHKLQRLFLFNQIQKSTEAFHKLYDKNEAKFISQSLAVPQNSISFIQERMISAMAEILNEMDLKIGSNKIEQVAQINIQIFELQPELCRK